MSDRSNLLIVFPRTLPDATLPVIASILRSPPSSVELGADIDVYDVDRGGYDELQELSRRQIPYSAWWGAGCEYAAGAEAFDGREIASVECSATGGIVVHVHHLRGTVSRKELAEVARYRRLRRRAAIARMTPQAIAALTIAA